MKTKTKPKCIWGFCDQPPVDDILRYCEKHMKQHVEFWKSRKEDYDKSTKDPPYGVK